MARKRTNGRFTKSTRRRRSKPKTNLSNAAVSLLVANSVSKNVAGVSLWDFFTAGSSMNEMYRSGWDNDGSAHNQKVTLREVVLGVVKSVPLFPWVMLSQTISRPIGYL